MTQPTKEEQTAAHNFIKSYVARMEETNRLGYCKSSNFEIYKTILSLLDNALNPPNLESLKRDEKDYMAPIEEMLRNEGWNAAIDHLAPRIVREGFTMMPDAPTEKIIDAGMSNIISTNEITFTEFEVAYKAMIAAQKGD